MNSDSECPFNSGNVILNRPNQEPGFGFSSHRSSLHRDTFCVLELVKGDHTPGLGKHENFEVD